jgi:hypothetical protein
VALLYYLAVAVHLAGDRSMTEHVACAIASGALGSLWWWATIGPWYFSVLHGTVWGTLVGVGAWSSGRTRRLASEP